jgi:hypothetical protein
VYWEAALFARSPIPPTVDPIDSRCRHLTTVPPLAWETLRACVAMLDAGAEQPVSAAASAALLPMVLTVTHLFSMAPTWKQNGHG